MACVPTLRAALLIFNLTAIIFYSSINYRRPQRLRPLTNWHSWDLVIIRMPCGSSSRACLLTLNKSS